MGGFNTADLLSLAASSSLPQQGQQQPNMTTMGPAPLQMPQPIPRMQMPQPQQPQQQNSFPSVGARKRYDHQAALANMGQMVKAGTDYIQSKKNRVLQDNISRLLSAQEGEKEAQEKLQQNPQDAEAQKALAHNRAIQNDITTDPKLSKQLQKAFSISLFDDKGKNKNEQAALSKAMVDWRQKKAEADKSGQTQPLSPLAQRFQQAQPIREQIDPQTAMQAQLIKMGLMPNANESLKAGMKAQEMLLQAKTAEDRIAGQQNAAKALADARKYGADKVLEAQYLRNFGSQQTAMIKFRADTLKANAMLKAVEMRVDAMKDIAKSKEGDKTIGNLAKEANILKGQAGDLAKKRKDVEDQLSKFAESSGIYGKMKSAIGMGSKSTMTSEQAQQLQKDLFTIKLEQNSVEGKWKDIQMRTDTYVKMGHMQDPDTMSDPEQLFVNDEE